MSCVTREVSHVFLFFFSFRSQPPPLCSNPVFVFFVLFCFFFLCEKKKKWDRPRCFFMTKFAIFSRDYHDLSVEDKTVL